MEPYIQFFEWTENFKKMSVWGSQFINESKSVSIRLSTGDTHNITNRILNKDIPVWIKDIFPLEISHVQLFSAEPDAVGFIHKDGIDRKCAFNVPVQGCDDGIIQWFDNVFEEREINNDYTQIRLQKNRKDAEPLFSSKVSCPALLNTNLWHRVYHKDSIGWRHMLSIRFVDNPAYEDVGLMLKKLYR